MILARELIEHGQITTTLAKAKAVQPLVEKLITRAKKGKEADRRLVFEVLADKAMTATLMDFAKTRFANRTSGFTRIIKLGPRLGDATETAMLSFVDAAVVTGEIVVTPKAKEVVKKNRPIRRIKPI